MSRPEPVSVVSVGVRWATRVTSIGLEFALPAMLGGYLDRRWGTGSLLTIAGAIFGFVAGMVHTLAIAREVGKTTPPYRSQATPRPPSGGSAGESHNRDGQTNG